MVELPGPMLDVTFTLSHVDTPVDTSRLREMLKYAASHVQLQGEIGIWLCDDDEIADLHVRYMDVPGATDVITFPEDPPDAGGYVGDIAVSMDTAARQANDAGHATGREIAYLCLHGLLHLAGYDDLEDDARDTMLRRQEELLQGFEREYPGTWSRDGGA